MLFPFHTIKPKKGVNTSIPKSLNSLYAGCLALHRLRSRMTNHSGRSCIGVWKSFIFQVWASFLILQAVVIYTATSSYKTKLLTSIKSIRLFHRRHYS